MKSLKILLCTLLIASQTISAPVFANGPIKDGSATGGMTGGGSSSEGSSPPISSGGDSSPTYSEPDPGYTPPESTPSPSPGGSGDGDGGGDPGGYPHDPSDSNSGDSGNGSASETKGNGEVTDAVHEEGKSDSGGGVGTKGSKMNCTIEGDSLSCDYELYVEQNMVINGTILQSVNNLNPAVHWTPDLEELPGITERIISGYDPIPDKELLIKGDFDPLKEYYEDIEDEVPNEILKDEDNNDYFYYADTIIDYQHLGKYFQFDSAREIDAAYTGEFNLNKKMRGSSVPTGREFQILGGDALTYDDGYDFKRERYVYKTLKDKEITKAQAINAIYKTFPKTRQFKIYPMQYELTLEDGKEDGKDENGNKLVAVGNTPFVTTMPDTHIFINSKTYYTRTFVTRNLLDYYWEQAYLDGLVTLFEKNDVIKLSQFSKLMADMLYMQGEEVLNEEEQNLLVAIYGKDLPYYLDDESLQAVRYLVARGIVEPNLSYDEALTSADMLKILMRAVDKNSRLDFKKLDIEYSEELVKKGYYPTNTVVSDPPIEDLQIKADAASASHYDYFIKKIGWIDNDTPYGNNTDGKRNELYTTFYQMNSEGFRRELGTMYVPQLFGYVTQQPALETHYMGVETIEDVEYYHFKIPVDIEDHKYPLEVKEDGTVEMGSPVEDGYLNVNTPGIKDSPMRWELEIGGGIYEEPTGDVKEAIRMSSKPIPSEWPSAYTDEARKGAAQDLANNETQLAATGTDVTFKTINLDNILWKGKKLSAKLADGDSDFKELEDKPGYYTLVVPGLDVYKALMKDLSYDSRLVTEHLVRAYVKDGKDALVSTTWLKRAGIINDIVEIDKGKKWILYANNDNILIDIENKRIVSGQIVTEIMKSDSSPLVSVDPFSKEILIDYRAVSSLTTNYLVIKDTNGNITMSSETLNANRETQRLVYNLTGSAGTAIKVFPKDETKTGVNDPVYVSIEESYPQGNYMIYRSRKNNVRQDYLIVFKPAVEGLDPKMNKHLKDITGIDLISPDTKDSDTIGTETSSSEIDADVWMIGTNNVVTGNADEDAGSKPRYTDKVLFNQERQKYYYDVPKVSNASEIQSVFYKYMKKDGSDDNPLPLVQRAEKILDLNINLMSLNEEASTFEEKLDFKDYPKSVFNNQLRDTLFLSDKKVRLGQMQLTVTGLVGIYLPYKNTSWTDVMKRGGIVFIGSVPVTLTKTVHQTETEYISVKPINNNGVEIASIEQGDYDKALFTEIFKGKTRSMFSYDLSTRGNLTGFDDLEGTNKLMDLIEGISTRTKSTFDFLKAEFQYFLQNVDDSLTILILVLLYVVPRFLLFHFIAYMTLVLVSGNRFVQTICFKFFDIYKIMSCGLTDVTRLNIKSVWISVFVGIVLMMTMIVAGNVLGLTEWATRFILKSMS